MGIVAGVGIMAKGNYSSRTEQGGHRREYEIWKQMIYRCYSSTCKYKRMTYKTTTVCNDWLEYQVFAEWCNSREDFKYDGYHLDKDLLCKGESLYSPDTCCFLPKEINGFLTIRQSDRGDLPVGVTSTAYAPLKPYMVQICNPERGKRESKLFANVDDASNWYTNRKEELARYLANRYKDRISIEAFNALNNFNLAAYLMTRTIA